MKGTRLYIYSGLGASRQSLCHTVYPLKQLFPQYDVVKIGCRELLKGDWQEDARLFLMPGGADIPYTLFLKGRGNSLISEYVHNGGLYVGICAGSYYGTSFVEFDKGGPLEVVGKRELSFFKGKAIGPAFYPFKYQRPDLARAAPIVLKNGKELPFYYNGGPYFSHADTHVVGRYKDREDTPPAIIEEKCGKGRVLLSGVHFEYSPELLDATCSFLLLLQQTDKERQLFLHSTFQLD